MERTDKARKPTPHDANLLSQAIVDKRPICITYPDGDVMIEQVRWHTPECIGLRDGKMVNKKAIKFWEVMA